MDGVYDKGEKIVNMASLNAEKRSRPEDCLSPYEWIMAHGYTSPGDSDIRSLAAYLCLGEDDA